MLIIHIAAALTSIVTVAASLYSIRFSLIPTYALTAFTLISGVGLVFMKPETLNHLCVTGLVYLAVMIPLAVIARKRQLSAVSQQA